jgi:hypothetical protein
VEEIPLVRISRRHRRGQSLSPRFLLIISELMDYRLGSLARNSTKFAAIISYTYAMQLVKTDDVEVVALAQQRNTAVLSLSLSFSLIPAATKFEITELVSVNSGNYLHRRRSRQSFNCTRCISIHACECERECPYACVHAIAITFRGLMYM